MTTPPDSPADLDSFLAELLEDDLLDLMLAPPLVPSFVRETRRPGASS